MLKIEMTDKEESLKDELGTVAENDSDNKEAEDMEEKDETQDLFIPKAKYQQLKHSYEEMETSLKNKLGFWKILAFILLCIIALEIVWSFFENHSLYHKFESLYDSGVIDQKYEDPHKAFSKWMSHEDYPNIQFSDSGELFVVNPSFYETTKPRFIYDSVISSGYYINTYSHSRDDIMTIYATNDPNICIVRFEMYYYDSFSNKAKQGTYEYQVLLSESKTSGMSIDGDLLIHVDDGEYIVTVINKPENSEHWTNFDGSYKKLINFLEGDI